MSFQICCPQCGACCVVSDKDVGKAALCGNCDQPMVITKTPMRLGQEGPRSLSNSNSQAVPLVDPVRARALTRPLGRDSSTARWRWGCAVALVAVGCLVFAVLISPGEQGREAERRSICRNNLKEIGLALHNYHDRYGELPPPYLADQYGRPMHSWRVLILPFLEEQQLYDRYRFDEPWDGPNNRLLAAEIPAVYRCPSEEYAEMGYTPYQVLVGKNTVFEPDGRLSFADIDDGASRTIAVIEAASSPVNWMEPSDVPYSPQESLPQALRSSNHGRGGPHVLYADGGVQQLEPDIGDDQLRYLIERLDGNGRVRSRRK